MSDRTLTLTFKRGYETWIVSAVDVDAKKCVVTLVPILKTPPPTMVFWDNDTPSAQNTSLTPPSADEE